MWNKKDVEMYGTALVQQTRLLLRNDWFHGLIHVINIFYISYVSNQIQSISLTLLSD